MSNTFLHLFYATFLEPISGIEEADYHFMLLTKYMFEKNVQVDIALLCSGLQLGHCSGYGAKYESNDII